MFSCTAPKKSILTKFSLGAKEAMWIPQIWEYLFIY